jgi:hypothetical protein
MRWLALFALTANLACVTIPAVKKCSVAGTLSGGMDCANTQTGETSSLTLEETIEFLEPQLERHDPDHPGKTLPARAGAVCQSAEDESKIKTALEQACRELGRRCSPEIRSALLNMEVHQP